MPDPLCPPSHRLGALLSQGLTDSERIAIETHVEACPACQSELDRLSDAPDLRAFRGGGPDPSREAPVRFGGYRVEAEVGRGGMGVVYRAADDELQRTVAVKVLKYADSDAQARFVREARAAAQIAHENVVRVFAVVTPPDAPPYLVIEYVDGPTLRRHIRCSSR